MLVFKYWNLLSILLANLAILSLFCLCFAWFWRLNSWTEFRALTPERLSKLSDNKKDAILENFRASTVNTWTFQENKAMHFFPHEGIKFRFNLEHFCQVYKKPGNRSIRQLGHEEKGTDGKSCFLTGKYDSILWIRPEPFNFCRSAFYRVLVKMSTNQKGLSLPKFWLYLVTTWFVFFLPEYVLYICDFLSLIMRNMWGITSKN